MKKDDWSLTAKRALREALEELKIPVPKQAPLVTSKGLAPLQTWGKLSFGLYLVEGRRELGDWKPLYQVWFSKREGRWYCTCYFSQFGVLRQRDICTHVAAVMLYRRYKKALERAERRRVYVAEAEVECRGRLEANGELHAKPAAESRPHILRQSPLQNPGDLGREEDCGEVQRQGSRRA